MSRSNRRFNGSRYHQNDRDNRRNSADEKNYLRDDGFHRGIAKQNQDAQKHEEALRELKARKVLCAKCGMPISEMANAIADKLTGAPVHFDCVLDELTSNEKLGENERISYIGNGRFAVLHFDNIRDQRHFSIVKTIEWEPRDSTYEWRTEMSGIYSQID